MVKCTLCEERIIGPSIKHDCGKKFHKEHLATWITFLHTVCPFCLKQFDKELINELRPRTEEEMDAMRQYLPLLPEPPDVKIDSNKDYSLIILVPLVIIMALFAKYISQTFVIVIFVLIFVGYPYLKLNKFKKKKSE